MIPKFQRRIRAFLLALVVFGIPVSGKLVYDTIFPPVEPEKPPSAKSDGERSPFAVARDAVGNSAVGSYALIDQDGKPFDLNQWFDKPLIVSFIYTKCGDVCPMISSGLAAINKEHSERFGTDYRILSVGFDPENDTPERLGKFASRFVDSFDNWKFVTGAPDQVKALATRLGMKYRPGTNGGWAHTVAITVLAPGGLVQAQLLGPIHTAETIFPAIDAALRGDPPAMPDPATAAMGHTMPEGHNH